MGISRLLYRLGILKQEIEFLILVCWILFFPDKNSYFYFLVFGLLMLFFLSKNLFLTKNVGISAFSFSLIIVNLVFIISIFFSGYAFKSILFYADIFLISVYYIIFYYEKRDEERYVFLLWFPISFFSLINIINYIFLPFSKKNLLFENPIHTGIISGIGVLVAVYFLLKRWNGFFLVLLLINTTGIWKLPSAAISASARLRQYSPFLKPGLPLLPT